jgi:hypothetical protein
LSFSVIPRWWRARGEEGEEKEEELKREREWERERKGNWGEIS